VEQRCSDASDEQRPDRAQDAQEYGFGEPLSDKPATAGADRGPHGNFFLARHRAREQQARDIHARDQEHHQYDARELPQHRSRCHAEASALAERRNGKAAVAVRLRIGGLEAAGNDVEARRDLVDAGASRQPTHHAQSSRAAQVEDPRMTSRAPHSRCRRIHFGLQRCRNPDVGRDSDERTDEPWWCDTDERVRVAVETNRLADKRLVSVEHPLPERMRDNRHANRRPQSVIVGRQRATESGFDTKNLEVVAAHELPGQRFWLTVHVHHD
jgi:hypothetical protein